MLQFIPSKLVLVTSTSTGRTSRHAMKVMALWLSTGSDQIDRPLMVARSLFNDIHSYIDLTSGVMPRLSDRYPVNALKCHTAWKKKIKKTDRKCATLFVACTSVGSASQDTWKVISEWDRSETRPQLMQRRVQLPFLFFFTYILWILTHDL